MKLRESNFSTMSDEDLVYSAQTGRQDAFAVLYERFLPVVYARVRFKIPENDVEDVTQEVFIAVLRSLNNFKGNSKFGTWIRTITNRKIVDYYRSSSAASLEQDDLDTVTTHNPADHRESAINQDELVSVRHALSKLPQNYQDILMMRFVDGLPFNEIARQSGLSLEATKSLFRRSVTALAEKMEEDHG